MQCRGVGLECKTGNFDGMILKQMTSWLLCCCILLALSACGNKGPLELPREEQEKSKSKSG